MYLNFFSYLLHEITPSQHLNYPTQALFYTNTIHSECTGAQTVPGDKSVTQRYVFSWHYNLMSVYGINNKSKRSKSPTHWLTENMWS